MTATAFVGGTVLDGTGAEPLRDGAVVADDGRVAWIGPASELPDGVAVVDVAGKHVIPGLLDANVHLVLDCEPEVLLRYAPGDYDELILEAAQVALRAGITTVFDTWGPLEALRRVRDRIAAGQAVGARIFCAGNIIGNGGPWHADFIGTYGELLSADTVERVNRHWTVGVGDELTWLPAEGVREAVREYIASSGIDFVKYASSAHAHLRFLALSPDAQRAICEEAHAAGLTAQACATSPEALKVAIESGVDLLQHGSDTGIVEMPQGTLELIVERQLPCVAFLMTDRRLATTNADYAGGLLLKMTLAKDANDRRLIDAGAKLMLATDGGVFRAGAETNPIVGARLEGDDIEVLLGKSHVYWFRAAFERGMGPMDALLAATRNIAEAYRVDDVGTLEVGKRADLVVLDGDPLADPDAYGRVAVVVKDGAIVDRERLPERPVLTAA
jgi:imidazolonepropionase-like amidohydrolase